MSNPVPADVLDPAKTDGSDKVQHIVCVHCWPQQNPLKSYCGREVLPPNGDIASRTKPDQCIVCIDLVDSICCSNCGRKNNL